MITKTSNDSAEWWSSVTSFHSFREASKKFSKTTRVRWRHVFEWSTHHMVYPHSDLSMTYLWMPELDNIDDMESLELIFVKVFERIMKDIGPISLDGTNSRVQ